MNQREPSVAASALLTSLSGVSMAWYLACARLISSILRAERNKDGLSMTACTVFHFSAAAGVLQTPNVVTSANPAVCVGLHTHKPVEPTWKTPTPGWPVLRQRTSRSKQSVAMDCSLAYAYPLLPRPPFSCAPQDSGRGARPLTPSPP